MNRIDEVIKKLDTGPPSSSRMLGGTAVLLSYQGLYRTFQIATCLYIYYFIYASK